MLRILVAVLLVLLIIGALPAWPYSMHWGYWPSGGLLVAFIVALIILSDGRRSLV